MGRKVYWISYRIAERAREIESARELDSRVERNKTRTERVVRPGIDHGGCQTVPEDAPPTKGVLKFHPGLRKAESSVQVQTRTDSIGLAKFLYNHNVLGILSAQCRRGVGEEAPRHMALYCTDEIERRRHLRTNGRINY